MASRDQSRADDLEESDDDPLRAQLLEAAARVFAAKGYSGTKIMDIVREAGLSAGAVYGRFESKNELLTAAIVGSTTRRAARDGVDNERVADAVIKNATRRGRLRDGEALHLEAFVAARRDKEVANALKKAQGARRASAQPIVDSALARGADPDAIESALYFFETFNLGLLLQRGAGLQPPDPEAWEAFVTRIVDRLLGSDRSQGRSARS